MGENYDSLINYLRDNLRPQEGTRIFAKTKYYDYVFLNCTKDRDGCVRIYYPEQDTYLPNYTIDDALIFWILPSWIEHYFYIGTLPSLT